MAGVVALRRDRRAVTVAEAAEGLLAATDLAVSTRAVYEGALLMLQLDLNEGPVAGGQMDNFTLGLNWYLTPYLRWTGNWVHSLVDRAPTGESGADLFGMRVSYEF